MHIYRQAIYCFHQVKLKNSFFVHIFSSFKLVKNSGGEFLVVANKKFTEAFITITGSYVQYNIKGRLSHGYEPHNENAKLTMNLFFVRKLNSLCRLY